MNFDTVIPAGPIIIIPVFTSTHYINLILHLGGQMLAKHLVQECQHLEPLLYESRAFTNTTVIHHGNST